MKVKLRLKRGKPVSRRRGKNRHLAHGLAALLTPVSIAIYALVAWLLHQNQIIAEDAILDAHSLPKVEMPNRNGFIPDQRPDVP